jgi:hypothetical protein
MALDGINKKVARLTVQAQLLFKVSKDLKGLMLRFYTNWSSNNKSNENDKLRQELINTRAELQSLFAQMSGSGNLKDDFQNMDNAIRELIDDKSAFKKIKATANIRHVKSIEEKSNTLIDKLEKEV